MVPRRFSRVRSCSRFRVLLLGWLLACSAAPPPPAAAPAPSAAEASSPALPLDPKIKTGKLQNGLTYFLQPHRAKDQRAHLVLVVKAGSLHEEDDQRGLAHFVEHMAFNGTRRFAKQSLVDFFEKSGMRFGSHANAATMHDRTQYQLSVPTDDPRLLSTALDILEDWATGLSFDPDEVKNERQVLVSEWTSARGAARRVAEQQRKLLLDGSKHAEREVIGDKAVIAGVPRERLIDFYRRWYRPERMAVIVVGDIDAAQLEAAVRGRFSRLAPLPLVPSAANADDAVGEPNAEIPLRREPVAAVITDPEAPAAIINVLFKAHARVVRNEADYRAQLLAMLSSGMLNARLESLSMNPEAPFTEASSGLVPSVLGGLDLVQVSARSKQGKVRESLDALLREVERVRRHGFIDIEVERARTKYRRWFEARVAAHETVESLSLASALANHFITGNVVTSPELQKELATRLLAQISAADVAAAAQRWLNESEQLVIVSGASRDAMPDRSQLLAALSAARKQKVEPHREADAPAPALMAELPTPGKIVKEEQIAEVGVTVWALSNGARVVLKATDFKQDEILAQSFSFGGNAGVAQGEYPSARFAHEIVAAAGLGAFDRTALARLLAGKVVSAYPWIDEQDEGIRASAAPKDAETMFQLIHLYATAPRRDEAAFQAYQAALREALRNRDLNPTQVFSDAVAKRVWGDHPRRLAPSLQTVAQLNLDTALGFYKQRFADMSDFVFVFVGKIDVPSFRPLVERYLASLPGNGRKERYRDLGLHRRQGITEVRVQKGQEDKATMTLIYHGESRWSEDAHTDLVSLQDYLSIRLREVLREELGGVYTPYVRAGFERIPYDSYTLAIAFECKSADVQKLLEATRSVVADVKKSGVEASYLEKLKSQRTRQLEELYRSNGFWLERLVDKYKLGEDPRGILALHDLTRRVTSENLKLAARRFLRDDQYIDARLTPAP